jgi:hypothetical protein
MDRGAVPQVSVSGIRGLAYGVDYADRLDSVMTWQPLAVFTLTNSPQVWPDTTALQAGQRWYRSSLVAPPY